MNQKSILKLRDRVLDTADRVIDGVAGVGQTVCGFFHSGITLGVLQVFRHVIQCVLLFIGGVVDDGLRLAKHVDRRPKTFSTPVVHAVFSQRLGYTKLSLMFSLSSAWTLKDIARWIS